MVWHHEQEQPVKELKVLRKTRQVKYNSVRQKENPENIGFVHVDVYDLYACV